MAVRIFYLSGGIPTHRSLDVDVHPDVDFSAPEGCSCEVRSRMQSYPGMLFSCNIHSSIYPCYV